MMYIILCYDVEAKRDHRVRKIVKKYLHPVQRSVMEGYLSDGELKWLQRELQATIDTTSDTVCIYRIDSPSVMQKVVIGTCGESEWRFM